MAIAIVVLAGCASSSKDDAGAGGPVTAGMVKKSVITGETTQTEVLEIFGPPDLLTHKDGREVWTYDKTNYDIERSDGYFNVIVVGASSTKQSSSSRSTMVIIYFDENEIVSDYRLSLVKY